MTNMPKLSTRATAALEVLADGGSFRYAMTTNSYTRREQFQWSLRTANGYAVKGFGGATYHELNKAGFMGHGKANGFTGSSTSYYLNREAV
jgi:hypothetical protein